MKLKNNFRNKLLCVLCVMTVAACSSTTTSLNATIKDGNTRKAKQLIGSGADVNQFSDRGLAPIHIAVEKNQAEIVAALIQAGAKLNVRTMDGTSPLVLATRNKNKKIIKLLLEGGAKIEDQARGKSPVFEAIRQGNFELTKLFMESGANLEFRDYNGETALFYAALFNQEKIVNYLVGRGADVNASTKDSRSPLHAAALAKNPKIVNLLVDAGARPTHGKNNEVLVYSSALLYKYLGKRSVEQNDSNKAKYHFSVARDHFRESAKRFSKRADEFDADVNKTVTLNAMATILSLASLSYGSVYDGTSHAFVPTYGSTTSSSSLGKLYRKVAQECKKEAEAMAQKAG